jgi:hypothetical protein
VHDDNELQVGTHKSDGFLTFRTAIGTERMRIDSSGNVGIGVAAPSALLHASAPLSSGNIVNVGLFGQNTGSNPTIGQGTRITLSANNNPDRAAAIQGVHESGTNAYYLAFLTSANVTAPAERMRITSAGNVAIGTTAPSAAARLDVTSTTSGFLPPRMTTAQRDAITSPPNGLMLYNTTTNKLQVRAASAWVDLH